MIQNSRELINLPVFTQSGQLLGQLADFSIDTESQSLVEYFVSTHHSLNNLFRNQLIINRGQIIDILPDKIIVVDNLGTAPKAKTTSIKKKSAPLPAIEKND